MRNPGDDHLSTMQAFDTNFKAEVCFTCCVLEFVDAQLAVYRFALMYCPDTPKMPEELRAMCTLVNHLTA